VGLWVQEQQYLSSLRHEKEAFTYVIGAKQSMATPVDQVGWNPLQESTGTRFDPRRDPIHSAAVPSLRRMGG
jgi:DNA excision repair protein ERCC-4